MTLAGALGRVGGEGGSPEASWEVGGAPRSSWDGVEGMVGGEVAGEGTAPGELGGAGDSVPNVGRGACGAGRAQLRSGRCESA